MASTFRGRSFDQWVKDSLISTSLIYTSRKQWRRGIRNIFATGKGAGRHMHASYRSMGDFHRANKLGNQPFAVEPFIPGIAAISVYVGTPIAMIAAAHKFPGIAGPAQSTAATGQISIGSPAGQRLISGKLF